VYYLYVSERVSCKISFATLKRKKKKKKQLCGSFVNIKLPVNQFLISFPAEFKEFNTVFSVLSAPDNASPIKESKLAIPSPNPVRMSL
jgi:hypothetical protein